MDETKSEDLRVGDEYTTTDGDAWYVIQDIEFGKMADGDNIVFIRTTDGERRWIYFDEDVIVK